MALDWIRRRQRALARGVLALFCLVWLQAALVPCAMALVPGATTDAPAVEHCSYCPPSTDTGHDLGGQESCTYPDAPQVDSRGALAAPLLLAVPVASFVLDVTSQHPSPTPVVDRPPDRAGPPLAVSYCRFLK